MQNSIPQLASFKFKCDIQGGTDVETIEASDFECYSYEKKIAGI